MLASHLGDLSRADPESVDTLSYGVDWECPVPDTVTEGEDEVRVDNIPMFMSSQAYDELINLKATIDPLEEGNQYGVLIYQAVADFIANHL